MRGWGAYLIYLAMDEKAASRIPSSHILSLTDWQRKQDYEPQGRQFFFAAAPVWDARAPEGQRPVTVHTFTDVDEWFTFHADETELEERDQTMLEAAWAQLHLAMPELGGDVEAIETATPRDFYDSIRRKLGMVGGIIPTVHAELMPPGFLTHYPNVFIVSDTTSAAGIAGVTKLAWDLARKLTS
jgi:phytoene dehydrogenase-like protein